MKHMRMDTLSTCNTTKYINHSDSMDWGGSIYPRLVTMLRNWSKCIIILLSHWLSSSQQIMHGIVPSLL